MGVMLAVIVPAAAASRPCGDTCAGGLAAPFGLLALPFAPFLPIVLCLRLARVPRPWVVAATATPLAATAAGVLFWVLLRAEQAGLPIALLALAAALAGPAVLLAAGTLVNGHGRGRYVAAPVLAALLITAVVTVQARGTSQEALKIAAVVPHPYRWNEPGMVLRSLNLNTQVAVLELGYESAGGTRRLVSLTEGPPLPAALLTASCAPALSAGDTGGRVCTTLPAVAPDLAIWRTGRTDPLTQVVLARQDVTIRIDIIQDQALTDADIPALAERLRPASAGELLAANRNTSVP